MPIGLFEKVDEIDAEGVVGLAHLPDFIALFFQFLAEAANPVGQWFARGRASEE